MYGRLWFALSLGAVGISSTAIASANVQECLDASESGQRARATGNFREAQEYFLFCRTDKCPALVQRDCAQWYGEVALEFPSVVFGARGKAGLDLFDVTVMVDEAPLLERLDGRAVAVNPGPHTFTFATKGASSVVVRVLVKQGEKARPISVIFDDSDLGARPTSATHPPDSLTRRAVSTSPEGSESAQSTGHTALPWVVAGVGLAAVATGLALVLTAPTRPEGCDETRKVCAAIPGESAADLAKRQADAGTSDAQPTLGIVVGAIGVGALTGGLLWHFLEPSSPTRASTQRTSLHLTPWWAGPGKAGATLDTSF